MPQAIFKSKENNYQGIVTIMDSIEANYEFTENYHGRKYTHYEVIAQKEQIIFIFKNEATEKRETKCDFTVYSFDCTMPEKAKSCFDNVLKTSSYWRYSYGTSLFEEVFARFEKMGFPILYVNKNDKLTCIEIESNEPLKQDDRLKIQWLGEATSGMSTMRNSSDINEFEIGYELEKTDLYSLAEILDYWSVYACFFAHYTEENTKVKMEWLQGFTPLTGGKKEVSHFYQGSESITAEQAAEMLRLTKEGKCNFVPTGLFIKKLNNGFMLKRKLGPQFILKIEGSRFIFDPKRNVLKTISESEFARLGKLIDKLCTDNWNATSYPYSDCESVETIFKS